MLELAQGCIVFLKHVATNQLFLIFSVDLHINEFDYQIFFLTLCIHIVSLIRPRCTGCCPDDPSLSLSSTDLRSFEKPFDGKFLYYDLPILRDRVGLDPSGSGIASWVPRTPMA